MSMEAASTSIRLSRFEQLRFGREVIRQEGEGLIMLAGRIHDEVLRRNRSAFRLPGERDCHRHGESRLIGQKITATLASTGTNSHFLHPPKRFTETWAGSTAKTSFLPSRSAARPKRSCACFLSGQSTDAACRSYRQLG